LRDIGGGPEGGGDPEGSPPDDPEGSSRVRDVGRPFRGADRVVVLAAGKAAPGMARAAAQTLGSRIRAGLVIGVTHADIPDGFESIVGGHPLPTADSEAAGRKALALAASVGADETFLVLISGGASALMAVPADGITLDDKRATTQLLLRAGADIHALNTVRKHLSAIKGGWLAAGVRGACRALAISDVVGDDPSIIASGPTVPDGSSFQNALDVLERFGGEEGHSPAVVSRLRRGASGTDRGVHETPKPGDPRLSRTSTTVIGSRRDAVAGAAAAAAALGYHVLRVDNAVVGEARIAAIAHVRAMLAEAAAVSRPACIVSSGETTVHVTGGGKGGRNQEFALSAAALLGDHRGMSVLASVGTDGIDGPTDAAGAVADSTTSARAAAAGLSPDQHLLDNDSCAFFRALGDLVVTGPTGTNVGDLQVILLA